MPTRRTIPRHDTNLAFEFGLTDITASADRSKFHFGFRVESAADVDAWAERLRSHGAQIISGPAGADGSRQLFFLDPTSTSSKSTPAGAPRGEVLTLT